MSNGSIVRFSVDDKGIFYGYVFSIGTDADENYKITAYDQMRYLKNTDIYTFSNMAASDIFAKLCRDYNLKYTVKTPTKFVPAPYCFDGKTLYNIMERGMNLASINDNTLYFIIDDFGTLTWSTFTAEGTQTSIQLGDASLVTSYTYEKSIDNDTFNRIKLYRQNQDKGKIDTWYASDSDNIKRWGILQYAASVDDNMNAAQVREMVERLLKTKNRQTETLKLQGEGVLDCVAGKRIKFVLEREGLNKWMWIKSSTHTFTKYEHTMDLEVEV